MKKVYLYLILATAILLCPSCEKTSGTQNENRDLANRLIPLPTESKESGYLLTIRIGHSVTDCGGRCITVNGKSYHINCMGNGHVCLKSAAVTLDQVGTDITVTTTDTFGLTTEDFFFMPDRSLDYMDADNNPVYLNIPEQLVFRDNATQQFTFTGLFITDDPEYTND